MIPECDMITDMYGESPEKSYPYLYCPRIKINSGVLTAWFIMVWFVVIFKTHPSLE